MLVVVYLDLIPSKILGRVDLGHGMLNRVL